MHGRQPPRPAGKRILIVEDNELNLKLLQDLLEYQGYTILVASRGRAAIDIARQQQPNLILLDIQLPDISGFDVASQLKALERTRSIPIIAVTAFAMVGDRERILASGCDDYIAKPFSIDGVLALIERYVDEGKATNDV
jgi:two-component system, cell cycle response regulator DivK